MCNYALVLRKILLVFNFHGNIKNIFSVYQTVAVFLANFFLFNTNICGYHHTF